MRDAAGDAVLRDIVGDHNDLSGVRDVLNELIPGKHRIGYNEQQASDNRPWLAGHNRCISHSCYNQNVENDRYDESVLIACLQCAYQSRHHIGNEDSQWQDRSSMPFGE